MSGCTPKHILWRRYGPGWKRNPKRPMTERKHAYVVEESKINGTYKNIVQPRTGRFYTNICIADGPVEAAWLLFPGSTQRLKSCGKKEFESYIKSGDTEEKWAICLRQYDSSNGEFFNIKKGCHYFFVKPGDTRLDLAYRYDERPNLDPLWLACGRYANRIDTRGQLYRDGMPLSKDYT